MLTRVIKPSYLVSLKSGITGGISYRRVDLETGEILENGADVKKWETTRVIDDKEDYERATKARSKAVSTIRGVCHATSFGLLCPLDRGKELDEAIKEANRIVDEYNATSSFSRVSVYMLKGQISNTDEEAVKALSAEVTSLIEEMQRGIDNVNVNDIRSAANRAKQVAGTLEEKESELLNGAIREARKAARTFVKKIEKEGEKAEAVLAEIKRNDIEKARIAFLDITQDEPVEEEESAPSVDPTRFAGMDVEENTEEQPAEGNNVAA